MKLTQEDKKELAKTKALAKWVASEMPQPQVPIHKVRYPKRRTDLDQIRRIEQSYNQLEGEWLTYYKVASKFSHKAKPHDRQDLLHDIMITLADVARNNGQKSLTEPAMYRIASHERADYWRAQYKLTNGLDCGSCSKAQRAKCRLEWLYSECPKAIKLDYLSQPIIDNEGNITELGDTIADDRAIDLDAWLDNQTFIAGCPDRLILIVNKMNDGKPLSGYERLYLYRFKKREQKRLL